MHLFHGAFFDTTRADQEPGETDVTACAAFPPDQIRSLFGGQWLVKQAFLDRDPLLLGGWFAIWLRHEYFSFYGLYQANYLWPKYYSILIASAISFLSPLVGFAVSSAERRELE